MECPKCEEDVFMTNDSFVDGEDDLFRIHLECPECLWQFFGTKRIGDLDIVEPVEEL